MTDPHFSNVVTLLHFEGTDGTQVFTDDSNSNNTWTAFGAADVLDDAQSKFGSSSLIIGQAGVRVGNIPDFDFGLDDFTWECWHRPTAINNYQYLFSSSDGAGVVGCNVEYGTSRPNWHCSINGQTLFTNGGSNPSVNVWHHIAVTRASGVFRLFMDGVLQGTDNGALSAQSFSNSRNFNVGSTDGSLPVTGHIDEVRITKGVARYTANFTPSTTDLPETGTDPEQAVSQFAHGQCRLTLDGTDLKLSRFNGKWLVVDGVSREIPSAGVSLSNAGLSASTTYFIYAYMDGSTLALEASTTGHAIDNDSGVEIKSGDVTRSLVGMARTNGSMQFSDSLTSRLVISWFNRQIVPFKASVLDGFTTSTAWTEVSPSLRVDLICWQGQIDALYATSIRNNTASEYTWGALAEDPAGTLTNVGAEKQFRAEMGSGNSLVPLSSELDEILSEGFHQLTGAIKVTAGVGYHTHEAVVSGHTLG